MQCRKGQEMRCAHVLDGGGLGEAGLELVAQLRHCAVVLAVGGHQRGAVLLQARAQARIPAEDWNCSERKLCNAVLL